MCLSGAGVVEHVAFMISSKGFVMQKVSMTFLENQSQMASNEDCVLYFSGKYLRTSGWKLQAHNDRVMQVEDPDKQP